MNYNITINTYEENTLLFKETTTCTLDDDFLEYHTDNDKIRINLNNFSFSKENNESILKLSKDTCLLTLKEEKQSINIPLDYINYKLENNKYIVIIYKLISQDKPLKIEIIIGSEQDEI